MIEHQIKKDFTNIYEKESDVLFRFVLLRVGDRDIALDITQDVFTKFWSSYMRNGKVEYPRALLFRIARNSIIDWYRKSKSESLDQMIELNEDELFFEPIDENAERKIDLSAEARFAIEKIKLLSAEYREVVYLRFVEDLKPQEISEIVGITPNAVSVRLTRGMEELRNMMGINKKNE
jgi:RNA polymerase sigma-70 factor (ECF subfamily)